MTIPPNRLVAGFVVARERVCSALLNFMFGAAIYHPHKHYMRGAGPKWRAKHAVVLVHDELRG